MWHQLSVATDQATAEAVAEHFSELGALSVSLEDEGDQPLLEPPPGETPLWNETRVIALFAADAPLNPIRGALEARFAGHLRAWREEEIHDQAWERAWLAHFQPMCFGRRLWVVPTGYAPPQGVEAVCINLDPGLAFGTGTHPTTALCLEWLDGHDLEGRSVLDFGCGSGILGIAALRLGAARAIATDIDPQALIATADNARKNNVHERLDIVSPERLPTTSPVDVLLANILANPLIDLAPSLAARVRPFGQLVLSGILREQATGILQAYEPWFTFDEPAAREDWIRLSGIRR